MWIFSHRSWSALRTAVADLPDDDFARQSGCSGWPVRDLLCHLIIDAQDVLITLVAPFDRGHTAGRHRTAGPDRHGEGRTRRAGDETPAHPRMTRITSVSVMSQLDHAVGRYPENLSSRG
ncbi:maleylpyruvate isomerase N-terminal domain-containing protein [Rhodococcus jostii]|uniref:maleylpyruvate isomerase N-terminal domain-containing protein n=1 Tax=Rhodococcus jostii TaxID=132919 RepID=UPI003634A223